LVFIEHGQNLNKFQDEATLFHTTTEGTKVHFLVVIGEKIISGLDVLVAVLMDPFTTKLTTALGPSAVTFLLANMANLVGLLSFLTVDALVTAFFH
jgi:hypothetical protein